MNIFKTSYENSQINRKSSVYKHSKGRATYPYSFTITHKNGISVTVPNIKSTLKIKRIDQNNPRTQETFKRYHEWIIVRVVDAYWYRSFKENAPKLKALRESLIKDYYSLFRIGNVQGNAQKCEKAIVGKIISDEFSFLIEDFKNYKRRRMETHPHLFTSNNKVRYSTVEHSFVFSNSTPITPQQRSYLANCARRVEEKNIDIEILNRMAANPHRYFFYRTKGNLTDYTYTEKLYKEYNILRSKKGRQELSNLRIERRLRLLLQEMFNIVNVVDALDILLLPHRIRMERKEERKSRKHKKLEGGLSNDEKMAKACVAAFGEKAPNLENTEIDNFDLISYTTEGDKKKLTVNNIRVNYLIYKDSAFLDNRDPKWYSPAFAEMNPDIVGPDGKGFIGRRINHTRSMIS